MARTEARIKTEIWRDEQFLALEPMPKLVYFTIISQPKLNNCGVIGYTPGAWANHIGITKSAVHKAVQVLADPVMNEFVVLSEGTEELWVRTLAKHDQVIDKPYMICSMSKEFGTIQSDTIRDRFLDSLGTRFVALLPERFPRVFGTESPKGNPKELAEPFLKAFGEHFQGPFG